MIRNRRTDPEETGPYLSELFEMILVGIKVKGIVERLRTRPGSGRVEILSRSV